MPLEKMSLKALATIDAGRVAVAFDQALRRAEEDCRDRPAVGGARKVSVVAILEPQSDARGDLDSVGVRIEIQDNLPKRQSTTYNCKATLGGLFFNEMSPEDVDQTTLDLTTPREVKEEERPEPQGESAAR